jgi:hypothetical protein
LDLALAQIAVIAAILAGIIAKVALSGRKAERV